MDEFLQQPADVWQVKGGKKRSHPSPSPEAKKSTRNLKARLPPVQVSNKFGSLSRASEDNETVSTASNSTNNNENNVGITAKEVKPPPIFIQGHSVEKYNVMLRKIKEAIPGADFTVTTLPSQEVKILIKKVESYRTLVRYFSTQGIEFYSYQLKCDRAFKVVLRGMHPSAEIHDIKAALEEKNFEVRNIMNIKHHRTGNALPLFFVDLEPKLDNKRIYEIKDLLYTKISFESPRPRFDPVQCKRCQSFGHTKKYCTRAKVCVRCAEGHDSSTCKKRDEERHCVLCDGNHAANYRGCVEYRKYRDKMQPKRKQRQTEAVPPPTQPTIPQSAPLQAGNPPSLLTSQAGSYAATARGRGGTRSTTIDRSNDVNSFTTNTARTSPSTDSSTDKIERLLEQLLSQNQMLMHLMSQVLKFLQK